MNTCGLDYQDILNNAFKKHFDTILTPENQDLEIEFMIDEYYFSSYYEILKKNFPKNVPFSIIIELKKVYENPKKINKIIKTKFNQKHVFARLDSLSTKPLNPYTSIQEIIQDMKNSDRTRECLKDRNHKLILREWIDLTDFIEIRCFIEDKKIRGISGGGKNNKDLIVEICEKISFLCDYENFTLDIAIKDNDFYIIEINTPVWLCSTSGYFDLTNTYDKELLLGKYNTEIFNYPEIREKIG